ncbi:ABC transporter substrate-binding protein [uncultured Bifidobacterium sp.]|uniref:ABC transporter substrate-binding protein n=1 Tax=uncultured Bifidobacterium sp. TaxID=165187 RepID=UPI002583C057|nr:ABC transporter substrate-binding protein [uncultured Bifidobacterium sp.]
MKRTVKAAIGMVAIAAMSIGTLAACGGSDSGSGNGKGKVYYLNYKPETNDAWQALAKKYTKETGVEVKVQTAASETYPQTLKSELAKSNAPTLFQVNGVVDYQTWKAYTTDMSDTEPYKQLKDQSMALKDGSKVAGVPYVVESYGLIYNKDLLAKYIATDGAKIKSVDDIDNFDTLKAVADDIQAKKDQLGVKGAFTSAGFDSSSDWRFKGHLANNPLYFEFRDNNITEQPATIKGTYLPQFKQIFDLYLKDSTCPKTQVSSKTGDDANSEFSLGQAVFYQNGTWAWPDLQKAGVKSDSVGMMPIYMGVKGEENQGLDVNSDAYWSINDKASDADKKATKDFLKWVVTNQAGIDSISKDMGLTTPFKSFEDVKSDNPLVQAEISYQDSGKESVSTRPTAMIPSEEWKNQLGSAMLEYAQGTGDWNAVKKAFVDNWKTEYDAAH